jgi:hypothetical protein
MLVMAIVVMGCGKQEVEFLPVAGNIVVQGKPLTGVPQGSVTFWPDASKGNATRHLPIGVIREDGSYELITIGQKGAPAGWYKVVVAAYANKPEEGPVTPRPLLRAKYMNATTTDLRIEVVPDPAPNDYDLIVARK